jgi:hypothetical protein
MRRRSTETCTEGANIAGIVAEERGVRNIMAKWKIREAVEEKDIHVGCLNCPPVEVIAPMDMLIAVGFGTAEVRRGKKLIFEEQMSEEFHTLQEFEDMAKQDPDHPWTVLLDAPLRSRKYQRQGEGKWVLIESGQGFA